MTPRKSALLFAALLLVGIISSGVRHSADAQSSYSCPSGKASCYQSGYAGLTAVQSHGRDTWYFWTGGDLDASGKAVVRDSTIAEVDYDVPGPQQRFARQRAQRDAEDRAVQLVAHAQPGLHRVLPLLAVLGEIIFGEFARPRRQ